MKTQIFLLTIILGIAASGMAFAAKGDGDGNRLQKRFERLDTDSNGRVDEKEFASGGAVLFGKMDIDGNGVITLAELEDHERRERIAKRFKRFDANDDGEVTKAEFKAAGEKLFERLDENEDGYLSVGELQKRRRGGKDEGKGQE